MKKLITTLLLSLLLLSILLTGCSGNQKSTSTQADNSTSEQSQISDQTT